MSLLRGAIWALLLAVVAVAGAGLIMLLDHPPTEQGRPELTAHEHALLAPRLAETDAGVDQLVEAADVLATAGRDALTSVRGLDPDGADGALATGTEASSTLSGVREDLVRQREGLTTGIDTGRLPESDRARIGAIDRALIAAAELPGAWVEVTAGVAGAQDLVRSIQGHDARVVEATGSGRAEDWTSALTALADAQRLLAPARSVRETAERAGADVATIDDLLARLDTYDDALTRLYTLLEASGGTVTDEIRGVYGEVEDAQAALPRDQDALMIVVSDLAGPSVTSALLDIEAARGTIQAAVDERPDTSGP